MLRRYSEVFRTLCALCDLAIVAASLITAYLLRFETALLPAASGPPNPEEYGALAAAALGIYHVLLRRRGLYQPRRGRSRLQESRSLVEVAAVSTACVGALTFFWASAEISRLTVGLSGVLAATGLVAFRASARAGLAALRRRGYNQRRVLLVGTGRLAQEVYQRLTVDPEAGLCVVGAAGPARTGRGGPAIVGPYERLREIVAEHAIDQVVVALDRVDAADPLKLLEALRESTVAVRIVPDLLGIPSIRATVEDFDGLPVICLIESPVLGWDHVAKRAMDMAIAGVLLVALLPLLAGIAAFIRLEAPRSPVLYRQRRMSLDGTIFVMLKFRTMVPDAEAESGPRWTTANDPRRTRGGAHLRRLNLDELPQLWNILRGDMSLVGPRPERPELIQGFRARLPGYMLRHKVKGGLTGWAQIHGYRGDTSLERRLELDMEYAQRWSLWLDLKILLLTPLRAFRDPNAY